MAGAAAAETRNADVLVVFGITGDLAKVMTFRSLYRLERRGLLDCPIVGVAVDDWSVDQLKERARTSIAGTGETLGRRDLRSPRRAVLVRRRRLLRRGDVQARRRHDLRGADAGLLPGDPAVPVRHGDQGPPRRGPDRFRARRRREAVRPRSRVRDRARRGDPPVHRRVAAVPDRPLPREDGPGRDPAPAVRQRDARAGLEPQLPVERPDHDGRVVRRRGPRPLLRSRRRAARRRREPPHAGGRGVGDGGAVARRPVDDQGRPGRPLPSRGRGRPRALRAWTVRGISVDRRGGEGLDDRDVRGAPSRHRELPLGRRPVLHPNRQTASDHPDRAAAGVQASTEARVRDLRSPAGGEPAGRSAGPDDRHPADRRGAPGRHGGHRPGQPGHGVRPGGRGGADARTRCCSMRRCAATARGSPGRTGSRRPGASSSRCWMRRRPSTRTRRARGGPRRPTGSSRASAGGTSRG